MTAPADVAAEVRTAYQMVAATRRRVTELGDTPAAWDLAALAADLERLARAVEAGVDEDIAT